MAALLLLSLTVLPLYYRGRRAGISRIASLALVTGSRSFRIPEEASLFLRSRRPRAVEAPPNVSQHDVDQRPALMKEHVSAADIIGVSWNKTGDGQAFCISLATNVVVSLGVLLLFSKLRHWYPIVYCDREKRGLVPFEVADGLFAWLWASRKLTIDEIVTCSGLDHGMLLEFAELSKRIMAMVGLPLVLLLCPLHWFFGGNAAHEDKLSRLGVENVVYRHPWMYKVHAFFVWYVVVIVQKLVNEAMEHFLVRRKQWLLRMPMPRSSTILLERIPDGENRDVKVQELFDGIFARSVVQEVAVVRKTKRLVGLIEQRTRATHDFEQARTEERNTGKTATFRDVRGSVTESVPFYLERCQNLDAQIRDERAYVKQASRENKSDIHSRAAFVTFKSQRHAQMALKMNLTNDEGEYEISIPPDPSDVIWQDLQRDPAAQDLRACFGYCCIFGIFWGYMPCVLGIAGLARLESLGHYVPWIKRFSEDHLICAVWDSWIASLLLTSFMSLLPTFFSLIFSRFFVLKAEAFKQAKVQEWYFYFQVIFVLLVTAVGNSLKDTIHQLIDRPASVFHLMATTLPYASHFYLMFLPLQWATHAQNSLRMGQFFQYQMYRAVYEERKAKELIEPEDQDSYGMGARSALHCLVLVLCLVFCILTPVITVLGFVNFFLCRIIYGYMIVFTETVKPDLGGLYWATQLRHLQMGMFIFIVVMSGVIMERDSSAGTGFFAAASLIYHYLVYSRFEHRYRWQILAMSDIEDEDEGRQEKRQGTRDSYVQPELVE